MTQRVPIARQLLLLVLVALVALSGCSRIKGVFKDEDADEGQPVEALYDKGHRSMGNGNNKKEV